MRIGSLHKRSAGFTLTEVMVAIGIMTFIFSFMAYLIFMSSKNAMNIHEQIVSQTSAASATERVVQTLRNSIFFAPVSGDDPADSTTLIQRVRFAQPGATLDDYVWGQVRYVASGDAGAIQIYLDDADMSGDPDYEYRHINGFEVRFETSSRLNLKFFYHYSGFGLGDPVDANGDDIPDNALTGQFITDVIAKNHHVGEGIVNYGQTTSTIARL